MQLKPNMYVRFKDKRNIEYIRKITKIPEDNRYAGIYLDQEANYSKGLSPKNILKSSYNIIDLIEYMDLLVIENKLKDVDNREIYLFNPVRCDGFTTFEDGKHCMIINMDYIVPIENIKVYQVLTHELFESMSYKVGE